MNDEKYMKFALELAKQTIGQTSPNPVVGAVIVKNGEIVGFGAHLRAGEAHAEVQALAIAGKQAVGATMYVTLEPCSHYGKTPPCVKSIIQNKLKRVVIATLDPHKRVNGEGAQKLKQAGIEVKVGILREEAERLNAFFFHYIQTKTPFVTLKTAVSLDGKTATRTGDSKWITGEKARKDVHQLRRKHDAILVGVETVIHDNPSLTARYPDTGKHPLRVILDTHLRTPIDAKVVTDGASETWVFVGNEVTKEQMLPYEKSNVKVIPLGEATVDIKKVLAFLGEKEIMSVFVEGGATVNGSFLEARMINQIVMYVAPKLIGGINASPSIGGHGIHSMNDVMPLKWQEMTQIGEDLKIIAVPEKGDIHVHGNC